MIWGIKAAVVIAVRTAGSDLEPYFLRDPAVMTRDVRRAPLDRSHDLRVEGAHALLQADGLDVEAIGAGYIDGATVRNSLA